MKNKKPYTSLTINDYDFLIDVDFIEVINDLLSFPGITMEKIAYRVNSSSTAIDRYKNEGVTPKFHVGVNLLKMRDKFYRNI